MPWFFAIFAVVILSACDDAAPTQVPVSPVAESVIGLACDDQTPCPDQGATCLTEFPEGYCTAGCSPELACPGEHTCIASAWGQICAQHCHETADCRPGYTCRLIDPSAGVCDVIHDGDLLDAGPDAPEVVLVPNLGEPCLSSADCDAEPPLAPSCVSGFEGGYCSAPCEPDSDECGAGALCLRSSLGGICVLRCDAEPGRCRSGYGCCAVGEAQACLPPDTVEGCEAIGPVGDGELGDACDDDSDCGAGDNPGCSFDVPDGYCTSWGCGGDEDCGDGGICLDAFTSLCLLACDPEADDCRSGQVCCAVREDATACVAEAFCAEP